MGTVAHWKRLKIIGLILLSVPIAGVLLYGIYEGLEVLMAKVGRAEMFLVVGCLASFTFGVWGALRQKEEEFFERGARRAELRRGGKPPLPPPPTNDPDYVGPRPRGEGR